MKMSDITNPNWAARVSKALLLVRILVGWVFVSEGIQKFLFPAQLGVGRFEKIGIPAPHFMAPFVGTVEIVFGCLLLVGLFTRLSAIPLLGVISVAILTTKIPMLAKAGTWAMLHEARTDFSMLLGLVFLLIAGGGSLSLDALRTSRNSTLSRADEKVEIANVSTRR
jgi:putative oxidoreductase